MKITFKAVAIAVALLAAASGCRSVTGRTAGEIFDNKMIIGTVKSKLVRDRVQNLTWVNVDAKDGVVYLTGNTETAAQKARATELAAETRGVKRVVNDIVVNSQADTASAPARTTPVANASSRPAPAASASSSTSSTARSSTAAPSASPAAATSSRAAAGTISGEVVTVDQGTGNVTLRQASGGDVQLRLPPSSVSNVRPGDRLSVSVSAVAR
jgi:hyperosmotically inducible protein